APKKQPANPIELNAKAGMPTGIQKNIHEKFLSFHLDEEVKQKLQEYGIKPPHAVVIHGPEMSQNKKAAQHIAKQLDKDLVAVESEDTLAKRLSKKKYKQATDIAYVTVTDSSKENLKKIIKELETRKMAYIL